jgi:NTP pyrophosphatase (non-canonical NTP hydrolase)
VACFGDGSGVKLDVRAWRFFEEATELVQAVGTTREDAHRLVDYVFDRPVGEPSQEVGGVMITLAGLCLSAGIDLHDAGETELARVWTKIDLIRAKNAAKPMHSPLPA